MPSGIALARRAKGKGPIPHVPIAQRGSATYSSGTTAVAKPTGVVAGDVIYIIARNTVGGGSAHCTATGFTELGFSNHTGASLTVLRRVADGSEGSTFTVTNQSYGAACIAFANVDNTTPEEAVGAFGTAEVSTTVDAPAVSPAITTALLLALVGQISSNDRTFTPPGSMTEQVDGEGLTLATQQLSASGSTGTRTFTGSGGANYYSAMLIALKPAAP